jgi:hypothetical protein
MTGATRGSHQWDGALSGEGNPDAPHVLVDVVDQDLPDDLLDAHRRHSREDGAALSELGVAEPAHEGVK